MQLEGESDAPGALVYIITVSEMGVHLRTLQEILGHPDVRVAERYTCAASPMARDAARQMGRALWGDK